jgi:hypothetical protein
MMRMIDKVMSGIGLCHYGDVVRGIADIFFYMVRYILPHDTKDMSSILSKILAWGSNRGECSLRMVTKKL